MIFLDIGCPKPRATSLPIQRPSSGRQGALWWELQAQRESSGVRNLAVPMFNGRRNRSSQKPRNIFRHRMANDQCGSHIQVSRLVT